VAAILTRCKTSLIEDWLVRTKHTPELNHLHLSDEVRTGHLPKLVDDLVVRLGQTKLTDKDSDAIASLAAVAHGKLRRKQGYAAAMLIRESRILQVTIFGTLHKNLSVLDFSLLLPDVMIIADEVDAQLTQTMGAFKKPYLSRQQRSTQAFASESHAPHPQNIWDSAETQSSVAASRAGYFRSSDRSSYQEACDKRHSVVIPPTAWRSVPWLRHQEEDAGNGGGPHSFLYAFNNSFNLQSSPVCCLSNIAQLRNNSGISRARAGWYSTITGRSVQH
jgi:hypothetical protein